MTRSKEVNNHPVENHENTKIHVTGAELQALTDNAVTKAMERQYSESSGTRSRTLSTPPSKSVPKTHSEAHSKPPSIQIKPKKEDVQHSSN